jgi:hypothetical protein
MAAPWPSAEIMKSNRPLSVYSWLALAALGALTINCQKAEILRRAGPLQPLTAAEIAAETNPLIRTLESLPARDRGSYIARHPKDARALIMGHDDATKERLFRLMDNSGKQVSR